MTKKRKYTLREEISFIPVAFSFLCFIVCDSWRKFVSKTTVAATWRRVVPWVAVFALVLLLATIAAQVPGIVRQERRRAAYAKMRERIAACDHDDARCTEVSVFFKARCEYEQDGYACWTLGLLYLSGRGVAPNVGFAEDLFRRACDLGETVGCRLYEGSLGVDELLRH